MRPQTINLGFHLTFGGCKHNGKGQKQTTMAKDDARRSEDGSRTELVQKGGLLPRLSLCGSYDDR